MEHKLAAGASKTKMGGARSIFPQTEWGLIAATRTESKRHHRAVAGELVHRYWKPVYCYLRSKGHTDADAKDLTQGFFLDVVLCRGLAQKAESHRGRFRTFLLTALVRYVGGVQRKLHAKKRFPSEGRVSLERIGGEATCAHQPAAPDAAFHWAWATALLDAVLNDVRTECCGGGKASHWKVFHARVLGPIFDDAPPPDLSEVCRRHEIDGEERASNMIVTVKRMFRRTLRRHVRRFVDSEAAVAEEIQELMAVLSQSRAGS